ncbi:MAG TPA: phosphatidylglycerophosphatase A [Candidatus Acidoferrum sp.]|jgi:phosphatidylglycerophosphatase A
MPTKSHTETAEAGGKKPRVAFAIATALGTGYLRPAPGTYGSLVGVATAVLSAVFFLRPTSMRELFTLHPMTDAMFSDKHFLVPGSDIHNALVILPLLCAAAILIFLVVVGVWSAGQAEAYSGVKDPQFVVIDEVAGQHLALVLPLIPIALPHLTQHFDFSLYAIFFSLSLVNWKYLLLGFVLFRLFDIWKPFPLRRLEDLPGGWGIMADDWMAGVYAAILLRVALHFNLV